MFINEKVSQRENKCHAILPCHARKHFFFSQIADTFVVFVWLFKLNADRWMDGWMDGWMDRNLFLDRVALSVFSE